MRNRRSDIEQRARIAHEAARLIAEQGIRDYHAAKRKAAEHCGAFEDRDLPSNREIESALREYQRLFQSVSQPRRLADLRAVAVEAMEFFAQFEPRLVGAVLDGTADDFSAVSLHLFDDDVTAVARFLDQHDMPYDEDERTLRFSHEDVAEFPVLRFTADDTLIDLTVLARVHLRQAPWSRTEDAPMKRASLNALRTLIEKESG